MKMNRGWAIRTAILIVITLGILVAAWFLLFMPQSTTGHMQLLTGPGR